MNDSRTLGLRDAKYQIAASFAQQFLIKQQQSERIFSRRRLLTGFSGRKQAEDPKKNKTKKLRAADKKRVNK